MLRELVEKKHICFHDRFESWQDAIQAACEPLLADRTIEQQYVEAIISCIEEYGPYIVIAPDIAMPHSTESAKGVNGTAIGFMKVKHPVSFDKEDREKDARLFFTLASIDHEQHLSNMMRLSELLMNESIVSALLDASSEKDLLAIAEQFQL